MKYLKEAFDVVTFEQAKHVVLSNDPKNPDKFSTETAFLIDAIKQNDIVNENDLVIDFGCGMGRVSKELVNQLKANVIGMDISDSMLTFAKLYVSNPYKFKIVKEFNEIEKEHVSTIVSSFVLQHVEEPEIAISHLCARLKPGGNFVLLNEHHRFVPSGIDDNGYVIWKDDGFNVFAELEKYLTKNYSIKYMNTECDIIFYKKSENQ